MASRKLGKLSAITHKREEDPIVTLCCSGIQAFSGP
jgi:hypothetical protein